MKKKILFSLSALVLACTTAPAQPQVHLSPLEEQSVTLHQLDQSFSTFCDSYTVNGQGVHCTLPKEPFYFHYRWDEIATTECRGYRLSFQTVVNGVTVSMPSSAACNNVSTEINRYLRLTKK